MDQYFLQLLVVLLVYYCFVLYFVFILLLKNVKKKLIILNLHLQIILQQMQNVHFQQVMYFHQKY